MALLRSKGCTFLALVMIFENNRSNHEDLGVNTFEKKEFDAEKEAKINFVTIFLSVMDYIK